MEPAGASEQAARGKRTAANSPHQQRSKGGRRQPAFGQGVSRYAAPMGVTHEVDLPLGADEVEGNININIPVLVTFI